MPSAHYVRQRMTSLRWRLPLLIFAVLAGIAAAFAYASYRQFEEALRLHGDQRLEAAAGQLAALLSQSAAARLAEARRLAADRDVARFLAVRDQASRDAAESVLTSFVAQNPQAIAGIGTFNWSRYNGMDALARWVG